MTEINYRFLAMGPGLSKGPDTEITRGDALEMIGSLQDQAFTQTLLRVSVNSLTVVSDANETKILLTTNHKSEDSAYPLNLALSFEGDMAKLYLDHPEGFFCLYDRLMEMDAVSFRMISNEEKPFYSLLSDVTAEIEKKQYKLAGADPLAVEAFLSSVLFSEEKNTYVLIGDRDSFCNALRHLPLAIRREVSFSAPVYEGDTEILSDVILCFEDRGPRMKKKAGYRTVTVTDRDVFPENMHALSDYVTAMKKPEISAYDRRNPAETMEKLSKVTGTPPVTIREKEEKKNPLYAFRSAKAGMGPDEKSAERRLNYHKIPGILMGSLIMHMSLFIYLLHNMTILKGNGVSLLISLSFFDVMSFSCIVFFILGLFLMILTFILRKEKKKGEETV